MKPCMRLCGIIHIWWRYLIYFHYIFVYHSLEGKLMNIWMSGYDDHLMYKFCLVFYFSCEYRLCYYRYDHVNGYIKIMCRLCHYWPLPMYPYVNVWIAKVRGLECNAKILVAFYAKWCCMVYALLCIVVLRGWLPREVMDSYYVIMLTNIHTHSHIIHAYK